MGSMAIPNQPPTCLPKGQTRIPPLMSTGPSPENPMSQNEDPKATPDDLQQQLAYLNLPFMREHVEDLARQAAEKQWSHVGFLGRLLEGEAALRQDRARARRIQ